MCQYFFAVDLIAVKDAVGNFGNSGRSGSYPRDIESRLAGENMNRRVALFAALFALARLTGAFAADGASVRLDPARDTSHLLADTFFALFLRLIGLTGPEAGANA
jgi:hypothetical protein